MSMGQETRDRLTITMVVAGLVSDAIADARHADREWPVCMHHAERIVAVLRAADRADRASEAARERKALDEIWEIASMADLSDPAFSPWGALKTIAGIVSDFKANQTEREEQ